MRIVVNGTFDLFHLGHLRLLEYCRSYPNSYVYVLIDSDRRVGELKGKNRPVNNQHERSSILCALRCVDRVDIFDSDEELKELIRLYSPELMVKGGDYRDKPFIGSEYCPKVHYYERINPYSTTSKIEHIANW
jgi:D-beta-D-heptose 7-phosphate kinase/D-beta-D-heptose 1-phosphate adenosyltransferase